MFRDIKFPYEYADRYGDDDIGLANTVLITRNTRFINIVPVTIRNMVEVFYGAIGPLFVGSSCGEYVCAFVCACMYNGQFGNQLKMSALQASRFSGNIQDVAKLSGPRRIHRLVYFEDASDGAIYIFFAREMLFGSSPYRVASILPTFRRKIFMIPSDLEDSKSRRKALKEIEFLFTALLSLKVEEKI